MDPTDAITREATSPGPKRAVEIVAASSLGGRRFEPVHERFVDPDLRAAASLLRLPAGGLTFLIPECPLPVGVPDLLVVSLDQEALRRRLALGAPPVVSAPATRLIADLSAKRPTQVGALASRLGSSERQTSRMLLSLAKMGAAHRKGDGWYRVNGFDPVARTYALEAKLDDWGSGLNQCLRYGSYADSTTLVMPRMSEKVRASAVSRFSALGVGLYADRKWIVRPRLSRHKAARRLLASEYVLAALGDTVSLDSSRPS